MESAIIGTVVIVGFIAIVGYAVFKQKKFESAKAALQKQIDDMKTRYNDLRK